MPPELSLMVEVTGTDGSSVTLIDVPLASSI
jgi:hypothetical protein